MGAHGTLEQALNNVASFRDASSTDRDVASKGSSKSSKHKSHKKHKKSKDKGKDRKDGSKKHKRPKDISSSDSEDNVHGPGLDLQTQLAKGREAVRVTRFILATYPEMRSDLRQVHYILLLHLASLQPRICLKILDFHVCSSLEGSIRVQLLPLMPSLRRPSGHSLQACLTTCCST